MKVHQLVRRCALAAEGADPMGSVRAVLENLRGELAQVERALQQFPAPAATRARSSTARPTSSC